MSFDCKIQLLAEPIVEEVIQTTEGTEEDEQQAPEGESPDAVGTPAKSEDATEEAFEGKLAVEAGSFEAEAAVQVEESEYPSWENIVDPSPTKNTKSASITW